MDKELLDRLKGITPEEEKLLRHEPLNLHRYNRAGVPVMETGTILPKGELFGIRQHTRFVDFPRHSHEYVEMIYQVAGTSHHILDGITDMELDAGKLLLLGRGVEHEIKASDRDCIAVNFILIPAFFDNAAMRLGSGNALAVFLRGNLQNRNVSSGHLLFSVKGHTMVENLLENLIQGQFDGVSLSIQQLTLELLMQHLSAQSEKLLVETAENREEALVLNVLSRIENQVRLNLSDLAEEYGVELSGLSRAIQRYTGCTFTELLQTARMNQAVRMLRDTSISVSDIATAIGYENTAFFYRSFQKRYGCTPGAYRKKLRQQENI